MFHLVDILQFEGFGKHSAVCFYLTIPHAYLMVGENGSSH